MTREELINEAATNAAQRVDAEKVGIDPITIITILTQVLPLVISCFKRNDVPNADNIQSVVKHQCSTSMGRKRLRHRTAFRIRAESDKPLTKQQAIELADAVIDECLEQNPRMVASVCSVVGDSEHGQ